MTVNNERSSTIHEITTGVEKIISKINFVNILSFSSQLFNEHNLLKIEKKNGFHVDICGRFGLLNR